MPSYKLSNTAKEDLIRIHQYGVEKFGVKQAEKYFEEFFKYFDRISINPYLFASVDYIRNGYRKCPCGSETIYYRIIENEVEIMAIIGKHDIDNVLK